MELDSQLLYDKIRKYLQDQELIATSEMKKGIFSDKIIIVQRNEVLGWKKTFTITVGHFNVWWKYSFTPGYKVSDFSEVKADGSCVKTKSNENNLLIWIQGIMRVFIN